MSIRFLYTSVGRSEVRMIPHVRIAHREGLRTAECIERIGDYAITRNEIGFAITHLPTGFAAPGSDWDYSLVELRAILERLQSLPRYDLQSIDVEALKAAFNP